MSTLTLPPPRPATTRHLPAEKAVVSPTAQDAGPSRLRLPLVAPLIHLAAASVVLRFTDLDRSVAQLFFYPELQTFPCDLHPAVRAVYRYGVLPGHFIWAYGVLLMLRAGWWSHPQWRRGALLVLHALVAVVLIVNVGLKQGSFRPRPKQIHEFGGHRAFAALGSFDWGGRESSSFPSGHAAIAFYVLSPAMIAENARQTRRWLLVGGLYGSLMGLTRIAQGGHFLSDVIWAGGIVYLTAAVLQRLWLWWEPCAE